MNKKDREILLAKIDALRWSFSDTQMQAIMATMYDLVLSISCKEDKELGFKNIKVGEE